MRNTALAIKVLEEALHANGKPYSQTKSYPVGTAWHKMSSVDCSELVKQAFALSGANESLGWEMPDGATNQRNHVYRVGKPVSKAFAKANPGVLCFFTSPEPTKPKVWYKPRKVQEWDPKFRAGDEIYTAPHVAISDGKGGVFHAVNSTIGTKTTPMYSDFDLFIDVFDTTSTQNTSSSTSQNQSTPQTINANTNAPGNNSTGDNLYTILLVVVVLLVLLLFWGPVVLKALGVGTNVSTA